MQGTHPYLICVQLETEITTLSQPTFSKPTSKAIKVQHKHLENDILQTAFTFFYTLFSFSTLNYSDLKMSYVLKLKYVPNLSLF